MNHKDGVKSNNIVSNLEWVTPGENTRHAVEMGLHPKGERHGQAKLTLKDVRAIRKLYDDGIATRRIAARFGISKRHVCNIGLRRNWKHA